MTIVKSKYNSKELYKVYNDEKLRDNNNYYNPAKWILIFLYCEAVPIGALATHFYLTYVLPLGFNYIIGIFFNTKSINLLSDLELNKFFVMLLSLCVIGGLIYATLFIYLRIVKLIRYILINRGLIKVNRLKGTDFIAYADAYSNLETVLDISQDTPDDTIFEMCPAGLKVSYMEKDGKTCTVICCVDSKIVDLIYDKYLLDLSILDAKVDEILTNVGIELPAVS